MFDIITIGDSTLDTFLVIDEATLNCDLKKDSCFLCLNFADKIPIKNTAQSVGGNAANIAVGAKKLGLQTAIFTELGDDINGHIIKNELKNAGVNTKLIKILKNEDTRYSVILNYKSERTILSYHAPRKYSLPKLPATKWIYYTSLGKSFDGLQTKLESYLKKYPKTKLAVNPGSYQFKNGLNKIKKIFPQTDLLIVNKEETNKLVGKKKTIKNYFKFLHNKGVGTIIITDGTKGSYCSDGTARYFMPSYPIQAIAKTGAGDAYSSGLIAALIHGKSLPEAMQWGTANACGVIRQFGAQKGLLNQRAIIATLRKYPKAKPVKI